MSFWDCNLLKKGFLFLIIICLISCSQKKSDDSSENKEENQQESEYSFYIPEDDTGDWVEEVVNRTQEEIAAEEIQSLLEIQSIIQSPYSVNQNEIEFVEKRLTDSNNRLKIMEYGNEVFVPVESGRDLILINKCNSYIVRDFYNQAFKLYKKEIWNGETAGAEKKELVQEYTYDNNDKLVQQVNKSDDKTIEYYWRYDDKNRVIYEREDVIENKKRSSKIQTYEYHEKEEVPPDYEYFENGEIQVKYIYSSKDTYNSQIFFEDDFSVITYYQAGKKIKEEYIQSGEIVREKVYE